MAERSMNVSMPKIMGVVNVTPDSFSDGGAFFSVQDAISHALLLVSQGVDILDIGGESTRPGADCVPAQQELDRVIPVIEALRERCDTKLSIDTRKPEVAKTAIAAGAEVWNDVSALTFAPESLIIAADLACDIILMHAQGDPKTMQEKPYYTDVVQEVFSFLTSRVERAVEMGVKKQKITIDPGIGFGKTLPHNLSLLAYLELFKNIAPVLLGVSRKSFIAAIDRTENGANPTPDERLAGSVAAVLATKGASILRVHDVAATRQSLAVFYAIERARIGR